MSQADRVFYITTPIYYVNAEPHLGHAYTTVVADVATRFHRLMGYTARFQTGTDEHGDKIVQAAEKEGIQPKEYVDRISGMFRAAWGPLNISHDNFIRTTDPDHIAVVTAILQKVYDAGDIYFAKYGGNYCVGCERFYTDRELVDGLCPDHQTPPVYIEEENYFFRMSKYQQALVEHIQANPDFIRPERYRNEVLAMLSEPLEDLCISRPKSRLTWGIDLPFDQNFVTYVWFDALINYLTGLGWPDGENFARFWPAAQHLIAKDILKPHAIYWPTMLLAAGVPLYQHLNVHGYWNVGAGKMSKTVGNVVAPLELSEVYGADPFRYFLMREMSFGLDAAFSEELLVGRYNSDLANDLGNLFSRVLNMLHRYRDGVVPEPSAKRDQNPKPKTAEEIGAGPVPPIGDMPEPWSSPADISLFSWRTAHFYAGQMHAFGFHRALAAVWDLISAANKFVVVNEPWTLAKDPERSAELDQVMFTLCQILADLTVLISPVMPQVAGSMAASLGLERVKPAHLETLLRGRHLLAPGTATAKPEALFPRIDTEQVQAKAAKAQKKAEADKPKAPKEKKPEKKAKAPEGPPPEITIEDFARAELRVGVIREAGPVPGADRLLKLKVDIGEEAPRPVVAGIAQHYQPDELIGKRVVLVANLKPAKLRGQESRGMVLAAVFGDQVRVVEPPEGTPPGAKVR